ncbi:cyclophilin-like fold protein [Raoultibacter timonensis]|uniref:Cyclophilin-like domain-containing protein n=1 Tax=Raoultibacter timonensis TaxID=1907662 RepID=A0ABM7WIL6_9ACTN|nr:cyclophilin-like fold protein [Raoultibacter timonensis]BDE96080.1 hypothetical protein CE91St30_14130 [Raoultibacter timonensis]BDF50684.1 hypothetical protein CE91St31_14140 [Raoultibacter timonensis]
MRAKANATDLHVLSACAAALAAVLALNGCAANGAAQQPTPVPNTPQGEQAAPAGEQKADTAQGGERADEDAHRDAGAEGEETGRMLITVGTQSFAVSLEDSEAARALAALLPFELELRDVNGNEKFAELPDALPVDSSAPGRIEAGDLMLYGDDSIVLFYESFDSPYSYTRLGRVDDPAPLADIALAGSVRATFEQM